LHTVIPKNIKVKRTTCFVSEPWAECRKINRKAQRVARSREMLTR